MVEVRNTPPFGGDLSVSAGWPADTFGVGERPGPGRVASGPEEFPAGTGFAWPNRRSWAVREEWPAGALGVCERVERDFPDWYPNWHPGSKNVLNDWWERPGFYALHRHARYLQRPVFGATEEELRAALVDRVGKGAIVVPWS